MSSRSVTRWMKIFAAFYWELQTSLDRMIQVICFKHFWMNVNKLAGQSIKEFEPTEVSEISKPRVNDSSDASDDVCGWNETETSKLPWLGILDLKFEADKDLVAGNLPKVDWRHWLIFRFTKYS